MPETVHLGRKISRLRELRGMKQETLAEHLGISQQSVSKIEKSEDVDDITLERIARALDFTPEAIKNFSEEAVINNIQHNYQDSNKGVSNVIAGTGPENFHSCTFNPIEKWAEAIEENKKLFEALLKEKDEKLALQQQMIKKLESLLAKKKK